MRTTGNLKPHAVEGTTDIFHHPVRDMHRPGSLAGAWKSGIEQLLLGRLFEAGPRLDEGFLEMHPHLVGLGADRFLLFKGKLAERFENRRKRSLAAKVVDFKVFQRPERIRFLDSLECFRFQASNLVEQ